MKLKSVHPKLLVFTNGEYCEGGESSGSMRLPRRRFLHMNIYWVTYAKANPWTPEYLSIEITNQIQEDLDKLDK